MTDLTHKNSRIVASFLASCGVCLIAKGLIGVDFSLSFLVGFYSSLIAVNCGYNSYLLVEPRKSSKE